MALPCDSAKPLLNEVLKTLKRTEEILSYIGIFYVGKLTIKTLWHILSGARTHFLSKVISPRLVENYGRWAVVSGSTDALGKAYAFELAKNGMNILLISDDSKELKEVACGISKEFSVEVEILAMDYSNSLPTYESLSNTVSHKDIGILINNAVFLTQDARVLEDVTHKDMLKMLNHIIGPGPLISQVILPRMMDRKRGAVINLAPLHPVLPMSYGQISGTASIFIHSFSRALVRQYQSSGIVIQTLLLGPLSTDVTSSWKSYFSCFVKPSPSTYVHHAISTLGYSSHTTGYWAHGILRWFLQICPDFILMWYC